MNVPRKVEMGIINLPFTSSSSPPHSTFVFSGCKEGLLLHFSSSMERMNVCTGQRSMLMMMMAENEQQTLWNAVEELYLERNLVLCFYGQLLSVAFTCALVQFFALLLLMFFFFGSRRPPWRMTDLYYHHYAQAI